MPANDTYWYNLKKMHVWFVLSCIGLFVVTLGMMWKDHTDEWRHYQTAFDEIEDLRLTMQIDADKSAAYTEKLAKLQEELQKAQADYATDKGDIEDKIQELELQEKLASRELRTLRAFRDKARADFDLAVRDEKTELAKKLKADFDAKQETVNEQELVVQALTTQLNQAKEKQQQLQDRVLAIEAEIAATTKEVDRLQKARDKIAPESWFASTKRKVMQWPIIDGFNSPHQIKQVWLPDLKITLGMAQTARFDRCQTCHLGIERVEAGNIPAFPHDPSLVPTGHPTKEDVKKWVTENKYPHPYATHPNPDLYLSSTSPHPIQDFGCTICHDGQGSGTSFNNVQHSPNDPHENEHWGEKYHYHHNHFWEYPMQPKRFRESTCLKCHHSVVELETSPKFPHSAPNLTKGFHTIQQYGCFGCHEMHGKDGAKSIGPDLRLEPNHFAVAQAISAAAAKAAGKDEIIGAGERLQEIQKLANQVADNPEDSATQRDILQQLVLADKGLDEPLFDSRVHALADELKDVDNPGQYRKVGPSLRYVDTKSTAGWLEFWTNKPSDFRPSTRMPQFFHLTNQEDETAAAYQPVQIAAISHYLLEKSQPIDLLTPPKEYQPDAARGQKLFSERGCLACHTHKDFPENKMDFGPNLDKIYAKVKPGAEGFNWLYSWIRDPHRYHKRTRMPNLYVQDNPPQTENGPADPAADITAFLLKDRETDQPKYEPYDVQTASLNGQNVLDELVALSLAQSLTKAQMEEFAQSRIYPIEAKLIKGDEIELVHPGQGRPSDAEWHSMKLNYLGRRTISQYGCYGCHDIPGFESAKPIGVALQDWGRKDTSRLAFEHIHEFLHHHNSPGSETSLTEQVDQAVKMANANEFKSEQEREEAMSKAYFYDSIAHHGRPGFIWQKLRQPRSYDYEKTETKRYDERLRMPKFPFSNDQIEAVATFVLGLTAEPPATKYLFNPKGAKQARYEGEFLLSKYNCTSCHMLELPEVQYSIKPSSDKQPATYSDDVGMTLTQMLDWLEIERERLVAIPPEVVKFDQLLVKAGLPGGIFAVADQVPGVAGEEEAYKTAYAETVEAFLKKTFPKDAAYSSLLNKTSDEELQKVLSELEEKLFGSYSKQFLTWYDGQQSALKLPEDFRKEGFATWFGENEFWLSATDTSKRVQSTIDTWADDAGIEDYEFREALANRFLKALGQVTVPADLIQVHELSHMFETDVQLFGLAKLANIPQANIGTAGTPPASQYRKNLEHWFANHPEARLRDKPDVPKGQLPEGVLALFKVKPPHNGEVAHSSENGDAIVKFHGIGKLAEGEYSYDLWETLEVGGRILLPTSKRLFTPEQVVKMNDGRGGVFAEWLVEHLAGEGADGAKVARARQSSPPPLVLEGLKVQTPWLYNFLKNPDRLRYETVLRMPRFNMSDSEARALANYFAAVDDAEYPYQAIPQQKPDYVDTMNEHYESTYPEEAKLQGEYLSRSWMLLNKHDSCRQCHAVGGNEFKVIDPTQVIHGPDLFTRVESRFRPEYLSAWLHGPNWILPYTSMVAAPSKPLAGYFKNDGAVQVEALRDALLNYNRLMQSDGKIEPPQPPAPMTPAGETTE